MVFYLLTLVTSNNILKLLSTAVHYTVNYKFKYIFHQKYFVLVGLTGDTTVDTLDCEGSCLLAMETNEGDLYV